MRFLDSARDFEGLEEMGEVIYHLLRERVRFAAMGILLRGEETRGVRHTLLYLDQRVGPRFVDQVKKRLAALYRELAREGAGAVEPPVETRLQGFFIDRRDRGVAKVFLHIPIYARETPVGVACLARRQGPDFGPQEELLFRILVGCYGIVLTQVSAAKGLSALELAGERLRVELEAEHNRAGLMREHQEDMERKNRELTTLAHDLGRVNEDLREAQARLVQADRLSAIGKTIAGVAHELNNPLTGILGFAQLLLMKSGEKERIQRELDTIVSEANRAKKIVQSLLTFARQQKPTKNFVGLNGIIERTIDLLSQDLRAQHIEVVLDLDPRLPKTMADFHQVRQVFVNLFNNAAQAMWETHGGGILTVRTECLPGPVPGVHGDPVIQVTVGDDGPGIPSENLPRIFDPFFTTKESGKGTGLGLSIAYAIVQEHGGVIFARSTDGRGCTFFVQVPVVPGAPAAAATATGMRIAPAGSARERSVLVVDDEETILYMLYDMLSRAGHRVDTAASGLKALVKMQADDYDIVICDLKMPGMDGRALFHRISTSKPHLASRFVFMTGDTANPDTVAFLESEEHPRLLKPFNVEELEAAIFALGEGSGRPKEGSKPD